LRVRVARAWPALSSCPGLKPAHEPKCPADGNRCTSVPISAVRRSTPGMVGSRAGASSQCTSRAAISSDSAAIGRSKNATCCSGRRSIRRWWAFTKPVRAVWSVSREARMRGSAKAANAAGSVTPSAKAARIRFQEVHHGLPIHPGRFHRDVGHPAGLQPIRQGEQVRGQGPQRPGLRHGGRQDCRDNHLLVDVEPRAMRHDHP